jgi:hypothetical protein
MNRQSASRAHHETKSALLRASGHGHDHTGVPSLAHEVLSSPGQPLDVQTRAFFEPRFGHSFSRVRVHTDARAEASAQAVNALAYTVGRDVVFGPAQYSPQTLQGRQLLAHELTHVIQQFPLPNRPQLMSQVSQPSDAAEVEADRVATSILSRSPLPAIVQSVGGVQDRPNKSEYQPSRISAVPAVIYRAAMPWPLNGYVINNSSKPVAVWSYEQKEYFIAAGATSGRFTEDVDHIKNENGQCYKIGSNTVTVDAAGGIHGYKCAVSNFGEDCPELEKPERSLAPAVSTGVPSKAKAKEPLSGSQENSSGVDKTYGPYLLPEVVITATRTNQALVRPSVRDVTFVKVETVEDLLQRMRILNQKAEDELQERLRQSQGTLSDANPGEAQEKKAQEALKAQFGEFWGTIFWWTRGGGQTGEDSPLWKVLSAARGFKRASPAQSLPYVPQTELPMGK